MAQCFFFLSGISDYISGVILYEETLYQKADDGTPFVELLKKQHIIPGIKVRFYMHNSVSAGYR